MHPLVKDIQKTQLKKIPEIKTGYTIRVHQKIKEGGKERVQVFEGLVIKVGHGEGVEKTITVRKIVQGIGVEKIFPIHSSNITKIEVKKKAKVRRSKLYYMRQRFGKSARLQERHVTDVERAEEEAKMEALIQEAVKAEEKRKKEEEVKAKEEGETAETSPDQPSDTAEASGDAVETPQEASQKEGGEEKPADDKPASDKEQESTEEPEEPALDEPKEEKEEPEVEEKKD